MRKELEAENKVLRARLDELQDEARRAHGPLGRSWIDGFVEDTRRKVREARAVVAEACKPATPDERRQRVENAFTSKGGKS